MERNKVAEVCARILEVFAIQYVIIGDGIQFSNLIKSKEPIKKYTRNKTSKRKIIDKDRWTEIKPEIDKRVLELRVNEKLAFSMDEFKIGSRDKEAFRSFICNRARKIIGPGRTHYVSKTIAKDVWLHRLK
jgi:hypothetical protein